MTEIPVRRRTAAGSLRYGRDQLLDAHRELDAAGADVAPLTKILGIALALDGLAKNAESEMVQASRTAGGLSAKVAQLGAALRSAEDELGRLRRAQVERPADEARFAVALEALTAALNHDQEYVLLADRERAARAVVAALNGMAWAA